MSAKSADPLGVRAYQSRLAGLAAIKDADWITRQRARTVAERVEAGTELQAWGSRARVDPDRATGRAEDLESHARVAALLRRADASLSR